MNKQPITILIYNIPTPRKIKVESTFFLELRLCLGIQLEGQLRVGREGYIYIYIYMDGLMDG